MISSRLRKQVVQQSVRCMSTLQPAYDSASPAPSNSIIDKFFSKSKMPAVPLDVGFPNIAAPKAATEIIDEEAVKITTLDSGLRVATIDSASPLAYLGVFIDSGSRDEQPGLNGITHFLEQMMFKGTSNRSDFKLIRDMNRIGANASCVASRENMVYTADSIGERYPEVLEILADVIQNSSFEADELLEVAKLYEENIIETVKAPDVAIMEGIHGAAYSHSTIGLPLYAPQQNVSSFTRENLQAHIAQQHTTGNMVVAGLGVHHDAFVAQVEKLFSGVRQGEATPRMASSYTGGEVRTHTASKDGFTHLALAFETADWKSKDLIPMCILQMMMGGGGAFSAGGPGKGMYSRLYENVLNGQAWVESATSFNSIFTDSGIFGFYGISHPNYAGNLAEVLVREAKNMTGPINDTEFTRAKNQLKSSMLMQLESRGLRLEDAGKQILTSGEVMSSSAICKMIDEATPADVQRVATQMLSSAPSVAAIGDLSALPRYDVIANALKL